MVVEVEGSDGPMWCQWVMFSVVNCPKLTCARIEVSCWAINKRKKRATDVTNICVDIFSCSLNVAEEEDHRRDSSLTGLLQGEGEW